MKSRHLRHGAAIEAPAEGGSSEADGFAQAESPKPPQVGNARVVPAAARGPRSGALRALFTLLKLGAGVAVVVGAALFVAWGAYRYAVTSPRFAVQKVELSGQRRLTVARVQELAGVEPGANMFALDVEVLEKKLLGEPWIREVRVVRELPGTLRVELLENDAGALALVGTELYLLTRRGEPFKRLEAYDPSDYPLVTGVTPDELTRDRGAAVARYGVALEVLRQYERLPQSRAYPAQEVHLGSDGSVVLTVGEPGVALHLGKGPWRKKLGMAGGVFDRLARGGRMPSTVFLDNEAHPERVVVRMR